MIRINKDYSDIPNSLRTDEEGLKDRIAKTTNEKRLLIIKDGRYPDPSNASSFDSRYKYRDIKDKLDAIYYKKCCYCETINEQLEVEHYRPKRGGYYWLAYSWDNLLLSCTTCNSYKNSQFPIKGNRILYDSKRDVIENIHTLGIYYDSYEGPQIINPESIDQATLDSAHFDKNGSIFSSNERMATTINVCNLNRRALQESRQVIWDELKAQLDDSIISANGDEQLLLKLLDHDVRSFIRKMNNPKTPYRAYYLFILRAGWINEYIHNTL